MRAQAAWLGEWAVRIAMAALAGVGTTALWLRWRLRGGVLRTCPICGHRRLTR